MMRAVTEYKHSSATVIHQGASTIACLCTHGGGVRACTYACTYFDCA